MAKPTDDDVRGAVARRLETDLLLGVRQTPLHIPRPRPSAAVDVGPILPPPPPLSDKELADRKEALRVLDDRQVKVCRLCKLYSTRTKTVFGQGSPAARIVFVGEAPGHDEDIQGLAFVGRAGQLLTDMIKAMGLTRDEVFICNVLKCRPPNNREPAPGEISSCWPYLDQQLRLIRPQVIVTLGKPAAQTLLRTQESIGRLRGQWHDCHIGGPLEGEPPIPLMPTYHPAYLLRNPAEKVKAWSDLRQVMRKLALTMPAR
ncbi:MAG TPA: uracil-DNA glycosylase [Phycisphaerae bacterium]|nr:uracil-DNA glycosylase [Phycisphaerae bacterium]